MLRILQTEDGQKMPFKIGFYALREFQEETKISLIHLATDLTMSQTEALFYFAYVNGCNAGRAEGWSVKYTRDEVPELLDTMFLDFVQLVPDLIADYVNANTKKKSIAPATKAKKASRTSSKN